MNTPLTIPKQPVAQWAALRRQATETPSLLDLPYRILTQSGRSAIGLALTLLQVPRGAKVLVPTYHCPTMIAPIESHGATPLFYPITDTGLPNLEYLESTSLRDVRAMLVPHLFGLPKQLDGVADFCRAREIALLEDCAHSFFGSAGGKAVGTTGSFAIGSLPKFFPVIRGGILASSTHRIPELRLDATSMLDELRAAWDVIDLAGKHHELGVVGAVARAVSRARHGGASESSQPAKAADTIAPDDVRAEGLSDPLLVPRSLRFVEALIVSWANLASVTTQRRLNYARISGLLNGLDDIHLPFPECSDTSAPYVVPIVVNNPDASYARMRSAGLPVFRWDRLWPGAELLPDDTATIWSRQLIQLACHQSLGTDQILLMCNRLIDAVKH